MQSTRETDTSSRLQYGLILPNLGAADADRLVEYATEAETAGWDGVFLADHLIYPFVDNPDRYGNAFDPWITLAGIATRTETIRLGTWVTPVPRRQPWQLARDLATLDHLSDGRVILGAGLGTTPDFTRFGQDYDKRTLGAKFDEALEVISGLWSGEPFSYDGEHYTVDEAVLLPTPVQTPRIPIVIGGWWPFKASFHRGARWDGIAPNWPSMIHETSALDLDTLPDHIAEAVAQRRSHEEEIREMLSYYEGLRDDADEVVLLADAAEPSDGFLDLCRELDVTWILSRGVTTADSHEENLAHIRAGPPS